MKLPVNVSELSLKENSRMMVQGISSIPSTSEYIFSDVRVEPGILMNDARFTRSKAKNLAIRSMEG